MRRPARSRVLRDCCLCFCLSLALLLLLFRRNGFAPFNAHTMASRDANIQYLDFFAYLKDVLEGKNSLSYTFSKGLGGSCAAVFSYYLSSPLNLAVLLFEKEELCTFFDLLSAVKISLCSAACCILLSCHRSLSRLAEEGPVGEALLVIASLSYALGHYTLTQSHNIMWLDGVYLLPLMLLGVHEAVRGGSLKLLTLSTAAAILFNWYTAGIDCLFASVWLFFELALYHAEDRHRGGGRLKHCALSVLRHGVSMLLGIFLSAALFLPTISALRNSNRGSLELKRLLQLSLAGPLQTILYGFRIGVESDYGRVSLYCGSVALLGLLCLFCSRTVRWRVKAVFGAMALFLVGMFYWTPLISVFSLFKTVSSYWYRYSYTGILFLVFAAVYYLQMLPRERRVWLPLACGGTVLAALYLTAPSSDDAKARQMLVWTLCFTAAAAVLLTAVLLLRRRPRLRAAVMALLACSFLAEMGCNASVQMLRYAARQGDSFPQYVSDERALLDALRDYDGGLYRVYQTTTRNMRENGQTANYNEPLAFSFRSFTTYTSSPDGNQQKLFHALGYRRNGKTFNVYNTPILSSEALMGVRYLLSPCDVNGYERVDELPEVGGKRVYRNPYALPFAFACPDGGEMERFRRNPFLYQNYLYSVLTGENVQLYVPLDYASSETDGGLRYTVQLPQGHYAFYGNLPWDDNFDGTLTLNHAATTLYAKWLSPSVFYLPTAPGDTTATVDVASEDPITLRFGSEQFYALDLDEMARVSDLLQGRAADITRFDNGAVELSIDAEEGQRLFLSIPEDKGWTLTLNGEPAQTVLFAGCLYTVPLRAGHNELRMEYRLPLLREGVALSCAGAVGFALLCLVERRRRAKPAEAVEQAKAL